MSIVKTTTLSGVVAVPSMFLLERYGARFAPEDGTGGGGYEAHDDSLVDIDEDDPFLKNLRGGEQPTEQSDEGTGTDAETGASDDPEADQQEADPAQQDDANAPKTPDAKTPAPAADDAIVEVKVGEETHRVPVKDLKRLFGQEAALTRRSQEVAAERTALVTEAERTRTVLQKALERAEAKAKPYAEMDFWKLNKTLDAETFEQLRKDAKEAFDEVAFLKAEAENAEATIKQARQAERAAAAQEAVKQIADPQSQHHVEGFSPQVYNEIMEFAVAKGYRGALDLTDPAAIKLLRMAQLYERGRTVVREKVKKVAEQPKAPLRPGSAGGSSPSERRASSAMETLRRTGSADAAEAAFMARLRPARDDD